MGRGRREGLLALNPSTTGAQRDLPAWASYLLCSSPLPFLVGQKTKGETYMAVSAFEPRAGRGVGGVRGVLEGWAADKECFLKQKRKCWLGPRGKEAASCCWWWLFCARGGVRSVP